jgi:hypothetical protein
MEDVSQLKNRLKEIDAQIQILNNERAQINLKIISSESDVMVRLKMVADDKSFHKPNAIEQPFLEYAKKFADQLGEKLQLCSFDDNYCTYTNRHEIVSVFDVARDLIGQIPDEDWKSNPKIKLIYDRSSTTYFEIPVVEALEHLYKWAIENKINGWEIDW